MKVRIELTEYEVQQAIAKAIKEKITGVDFYNHQVKVEGSVKVKGKAVRKPVVRIKAYVEADQ
jgi:ribosome-associated translation inhibitor RaiA